MGYHNQPQTFSSSLFILAGWHGLGDFRYLKMLCFPSSKLRWYVTNHFASRCSGSTCCYCRLLRKHLTLSSQVLRIHLLILSPKRATYIFRWSAPFRCCRYYKKQNTFHFQMVRAIQVLRIPLLGLSLKRSPSISDDPPAGIILALSIFKWSERLRCW